MQVVNKFKKKMYPAQDFSDYGLRMVTFDYDLFQIIYLMS